MDQKYKLLKAMKNNSKNISFDDIKKFLEGNGYEAHYSGGSHFVFRKDGCEHIVIPYHKPIKAIYVKQVLEILESEQ